jgi:hypothetical protein
VVIELNEEVKAHDDYQRSINVPPCPRTVKVAYATVGYHNRVEVVRIDATSVEKAILPMSIVGYAATVGATVIKAHPLIPRITRQSTSGHLDTNGGRFIVSPQGSISTANGTIASSEGARKAADVNSNSAAVARGS